MEPCRLCSSATNSVHLDETKRFNIGEINPNRIADILLYLSGLTYDNLVCDCLALRDNHQLCDWAYLLMLKGITDQFCGTDTNESALLWATSTISRATRSALPRTTTTISTCSSPPTT